MGSRQAGPPLGAAWRARTQARLVRAQCSALLRNRHDSAVLLLGAGAVVALAVAEVGYQLGGHPPPGCASLAFLTGLGVPPGCEPAFRVSVALFVARCLVGGGCLGALWLLRVLHIVARQRAEAHGSAGGAAARLMERRWGPAAVAAEEPAAQRPGRAGGADRQRWGLSDVHDWNSGTAGWAFAASKESWLEAMGAVRSNAILFLGTTLLTTAAGVVVNLLIALTEDGLRAGASWEYACRTCAAGDDPAAVTACIADGGAPLNLCFAAWHGRASICFVQVGQIISLGLITTFTCLPVWSPLSVAAGDATGLRWPTRWRVLHLLLLPCVAHVAFPLAALAAIELCTAPRAMVVAYGCSGAAFIAIQGALCVFALSGGAAGGGSPRPVTPWAAAAGWAASLARLPFRVYRAYMYESASMHNKRMFLLALITLTYGASNTTYGAAYYAFLTVMRAVWALVFLLAADRPCSFADLKCDPHGAGFGLVVDACMLREALRRHLAGYPPLEHLPMYKATVFRMEAAMTVSYRWQGAKAWVCPGLVLNMSCWQMEELVEALGDTSCFYVWIDRVSVPQHECELQDTLLSRMMATYALSRETLVLRSLELPSSRYHERAWTLPEFACPASQRICTELCARTGRADEAAAAWGEAPTAVTATEEAQLAEVRQHFLTSVPRCWPMWLRREPGELRLGCALSAAWGLWERIGERLNCSVPEDRIRAVYPLLFCTPVESHEELASLVDAVATALEAEAPGSERACKARRHWHEIVGAAVCDPVEEAVQGQRPGAGGPSLLGSIRSHTASAFASAMRIARSSRMPLVDSARRSTLGGRSLYGSVDL